VLARLNRTVAGAGPEALMALLLELTTHAEGGRLWFRSVAHDRPGALPALTGWVRRLLTSDAVLALVTEPLDSLPPDMRLRVEMIGPDLDRLIAGLDRAP
jgi:hypothetical protein